MSTVGELRKYRTGIHAHKNIFTYTFIHIYRLSYPRLFHKSNSYRETQWFRGL